MKKLIALSVVLALFSGYSRPDAAQPSKGLEKLMEQKLKSAKVLLEGLALADFPKISRSAEELLQLTRTEDWIVIKTARYEMHSNEFRRAAETIASKARSKNLDGAALAYFDMTMSCIRCHQYIREIREARLQPPGSSPLAKE